MGSISQRNAASAGDKPGGEVEAINFSNRGELCESSPEQRIGNRCAKENQNGEISKESRIDLADFEE